MTLGGAVAAILITEDEAQVRVLSESFLQDQGQRTLSAASPEEALALLGMIRTTSSACSRTSSFEATSRPDWI